MFLLLFRFSLKMLTRQTDCEYIFCEMFSVGPEFERNELCQEDK
jgi:hypothetical protein